MGRANLNWEDLHYFYVLANTGGMAAAASQLGVNQSTVYRRLQSLEKQSGGRLFIRRRSGYELTTAGKRLYDKVADIGQGLATIEKDFQVVKHNVVRIATFSAFAEDYLPAILESLQNRFNDSKFEVITAREASDLIERNVDIAFRSCDKPPPHLVGKQVAKKLWGLYASSEYLRNRPAKVDLQIKDWYQSYHFLRYPNKQQLAAYRWLNQILPEDHQRGGANSLEVIAAMCRSGLGVALLCDGLRTNGLTKLATLPDEMASDFWLLYHPELRQQKSLVQLVAALKEEILTRF